MGTEAGICINEGLWTLQGSQVNTRFLGSSCEPGPGLDSDSMERRGLLSRQPQSNGRNMLWIRSNNRGVVSFSRQDNVVNNFIGRSQKVLIRVSSSGWGWEGGVKKASVAEEPTCATPWRSDMLLYQAGR